jgi:hypothetical protein
MTRLPEHKKMETVKAASLVRCSTSFRQEYRQGLVSNGKPVKREDSALSADSYAPRLRSEPQTAKRRPSRRIGVSGEQDSR